MFLEKVAVFGQLYALSQFTMAGLPVPESDISWVIKQLGYNDDLKWYEVIKNHEHIQKKDGNITVTDKGLKYAEYLCSPFF